VHLQRAGYQQILPFHKFVINVCSTTCAGLCYASIFPILPPLVLRREHAICRWSYSSREVDLTIGNAFAYGLILLGYLRIRHQQARLGTGKAGRFEHNRQ
jgi:hypothetical protein